MSIHSTVLDNSLSAAKELEPLISVWSSEEYGKTKSKHFRYDFGLVVL